MDFLGLAVFLFGALLFLWTITLAISEIFGSRVAFVTIIASTVLFAAPVAKLLV